MGFARQRKHASCHGRPLEYNNYNIVLFALCIYRELCLDSQYIMYAMGDCYHDKSIYYYKFSRNLS